MAPPLRCWLAVVLLAASAVALSSSSRKDSSLPQVGHESRSSSDESLRDCSDLSAGDASGIYTVYPAQDDTAVDAYCDNTEGAGWTVIQRRADFAPLQDFYQDWDAYKSGFGDLNKEFYWGNQHIWDLTKSMDRQYELHIQLEDFAGETPYALYQDFKIADEADFYRLSIGNYSGDAGDSLTYSNGIQFSTKDNDHDSYLGNCAEQWAGAWWYDRCTYSNLNGVHEPEGMINKTSIYWYDWHSLDESLKAAEMKIRPAGAQ